MRTTVTLDEDLAARLKELAHRRRAPFKDVINDVIRRGLAAADEPGTVQPFRVVPHAGGFLPGVDPGRLNQLLDELDAAEFLAAQRQ